MDDEINANAPDWSNEPASDQLLAEKLEHDLAAKREDAPDDHRKRRLLARLQELGFGKRKEQR